MPVTSRRQQVANISGAGKKTPMISYNHNYLRLIQKGCICPPLPYAKNIIVTITTTDITISWDPVENAINYFVTLYSSLNYNVTTLDTLVISGSAVVTNITFPITPTPTWYAAVVTAITPSGSSTSPISESSVVPKFSALYDVVGTYNHPLPILPPGKTWSIAYELLGGGGGGGGGAPDIPGIPTLYGDAGLPGDDAVLNMNVFSSTQPALTIIVVSDGGDGGAIGVIGGTGGNAFITDGVFSDIGAGGFGGLPGPFSVSLVPQLALPVSGVVGSGGKGGDSNTAGDKGVAGYVKFVATFVP